VSTESNILTPEFRLSYPALFKAKAGPNGGAAKYSLVMIFDSAADISALKRAANAVAVAKWGAERLQNKDFAASLRSPFRKGDEGSYIAKDGFGPGVIFINAKSDNQPELLDQAKKPLTSERDLYGGCYARAVVAAFAYDPKEKNIAGQKGVGFAVRLVQKIRDGKPFGAGGSVASMVDEVAVDPTTPTESAPQGGTPEGGFGFM
jgi:hypothetical protein